MCASQSNNGSAVCVCVLWHEALKQHNIDVVVVARCLDLSSTDRQEQSWSEGKKVERGNTGCQCVKGDRIFTGSQGKLLSFRFVQLLPFGIFRGEKSPEVPQSAALDLME